MDQVGQVVQLGQAHWQQREQIHWARRSYNLDSHALCLAALDHSKEEIRSHYDTYVSRIDTSLLMLALIWPFALNTIQFSDPFVPQTASQCSETGEDCIEADHPWLIGVWVVLLGIILILPFWGILMLIRTKLKLDSWLEFSLAFLYRERRAIVDVASTIVTDSTVEAKDDDDATEQVVYHLVNVVQQCQEYLADIWTAECGWLVHAATTLLWVSGFTALALTSLSLWIFLRNRGSAFAFYSNFFALIIISGVFLPGFYVLYMSRSKEKQASPPQLDSEDLSQSLFPLTSPTARKMPGEWSKRAMAGGQVSGKETHWIFAIGLGIFRNFGIKCQQRKKRHSLKVPMIQTEST